MRGASDSKSDRGKLLTVPVTVPHCSRRALMASRVLKTSLLTFFSRRNHLRRGGGTAQGVSQPRLVVPEGTREFGRNGFSHRDIESGE